jgi:hypothetical protein
MKRVNDALQPVPELGEYPLAGEPRRGDDVEVKKPSYHCPVCGGPTYFKSAEGWRPFCSEVCAKKAVQPGKTKDHVTLKPVPVSGERELRYTARDSERAEREWARKYSMFREALLKLGYTQPNKFVAEFVHASLPTINVRGGSGGGVRWESGGKRGTNLEALRRQLQQGEAKDSALSTGFLAALIAVLAWAYHRKETVGPQDYDLTRYQPQSREW